MLWFKWQNVFGLLQEPLGAGISGAVSAPTVTPMNQVLAAAAGGGIGGTGATEVAALFFLGALLWVAALKLRERRQNLALKEQLERERKLSALGRKLAEARTAPEAARIILEAADHLFGWDAAYLNLYSAKEDLLEPVVNLDLVDGKRAEVPFGYPAGKPTPMARKIIDGGAKLISRDKKDLSAKMETLAFGDKGRMSASLMFAPIHGSEGVIGLVSIQSYKVGFYDEEKLGLLQGLADHCGGAVERIRAQREVDKSVALLEERVKERTGELTQTNVSLEKSREELEKVVEARTAKLTSTVGALKKEIVVRREAEERSAVFSQLGAQLSAASDFATAGQVALDAADKLLGWEASYLHLYTPDYRFTIPVLAYDIVEGKRAQVFYLSREVSERDKRIIEHGAELVNGPAKPNQPALVPFGVRTRPTASRLFVPIRSGGQVIGALSTQSYAPEAYAEEGLVLLQSVADYCGGTLERIQAEQRMRQSEERFSSVFRSSPTPMSLTTLEQGIYMDVNESLTNLLGYTREEMLGRTSLELHIWTDPEDRLKMTQQVMANKSLRNYQTQMRTKGGAIRTALASVERLDFRGDPTMLLATFHDITDWLNLEAQLRLSQKMEAVGQLAAGVAHDFNNILTIIQGHVGLLVEDPAVSPEVRESLKPVATAADRAAALTRQLLAFSRKQMMQMRAIDLNDVVSDAANMLQRLLGENIQLAFNYSRAPARVEGDSAMLEQVIINLAVNARDAMPAGGKLNVAVDLTEVEAAVAAQRTEMEATRFVRLTVSDTGKGMDEATRGRIFEPFFTTKDVGRGSGLGLATVYGVIKQHRGWIDVESVLGQGTVFRIYLPEGAGAKMGGAGPGGGTTRFFKKESEKLEAPATGAKTAQGHGETVLVVEDEEDLRELVRTLLTSFGYRVLEAEHGKQALEVWAEAGGKIDLLLTDVTMPEGISGLQLAERFRKENPMLKVIFSSGYSAELFERRKIPGLKEGLNFLPKPYQPDTLAATVRQCLDAGS